MTDPSGPAESDRDAAVARAKLLGERRGPRKDSAPARILAAGFSASAALVMVGAMALSARSAPPAPPGASEVVERVVVIEIPAASPSSASQTPSASAPSTEQVTVVRDVQVLPGAAVNPVLAPAPTQGS